MKSMTSYGKCYICQKTFSKKVMTKHLKSCIKRSNTIEAPSSQKNIKKVKYFHIIAEGKDYLSDYWLHIKASAAATLEELDNLLREIWLECCGHLSLFRIDSEEYFSEPDEDWEQEGMNVKLNNILSLNKKFYHEYDFGSTTHLKFKVAAESYNELKGSNIEVIARNDQPPIICSYCVNLQPRYARNVYGPERDGYVTIVQKTTNAAKKCFCLWLTRHAQEYVDIQDIRIIYYKVIKNCFWNFLCSFLCC